MEAGERRHHGREKGRDRRRRELVLDLDRLARARIDLGKLGRGEQGRESPDHEEENEKQRRRIRQLVPYAFDRVEGAIDEARRFGGGGFFRARRFFHGGEVRNLARLPAPPPGKQSPIRARCEISPGPAPRHRWRAPLCRCRGGGRCGRMKRRVIPRKQRSAFPSPPVIRGLLQCGVACWDKSKRLAKAPAEIPPRWTLRCAENEDWPGMTR